MKRLIENQVENESNGQTPPAESEKVPKFEVKTQPVVPGKPADTQKTEELKEPVLHRGKNNVMDKAEAKEKAETEKPKAQKPAKAEKVKAESSGRRKWQKLKVSSSEVTWNNAPIKSKAIQTEIRIFFETIIPKLQAEK